MILSCLILYVFAGLLLGVGFGMCAFLIGIIVTNENEEASAVFALIIFLTVLGGCVWYGASSTMVTETHQIYSIGDSLGVEGSFVLGTGSINSVPVYLFYQDAGNGGYKLGHVEATHSVIYEDAPAHTGYITATYPSCESPNGWDIHVPKGTIKREYNLDSS